MPFPLVIYHANCADGFAAAWCFWRKFGYNAEYVPGVYQKDPPDVRGRDVYLVDFSYKREVVEHLLAEANSLTLIDHHKTAIEDLTPLLSMGYGNRLGWFCNINHSGAMLAWIYLFFGEDPPRLLCHVQDRDLWHFKLAKTREIMAFVFSHGYSFELWDKLMSANQVELEMMAEAGAAIERKHHKDVADLVNACKRRMVIGGYDVPVAGLPHTMASDAGHLMAHGEPFAACYWDSAENRVFSLRATDGGVDVEDVAKQYGGGGHAKAAGFKVPRDHPLAVW